MNIEKKQEKLIRSLENSGMTNTVWGHSGNVVCYTTEGHGHHLLPQHEEVNFNVHLICETEKVKNAGNLPEEIDEEEHGKIFVNMIIVDNN